MKISSVEKDLVTKQVVLLHIRCTSKPVKELKAYRYHKINQSLFTINLNDMFPPLMVIYKLYKKNQSFYSIIKK